MFGDILQFCLIRKLAEADKMLEECTEKIKQMHHAVNNTPVDLKLSHDNIATSDANSAVLDSDNKNVNGGDNNNNNNNRLNNTMKDVGHAENKHAKNFLRRSTTDAMQIDTAEEEKLQQEKVKKDEEAQEYYKHLRSLRLSVVKK